MFRPTHTPEFRGGSGEPLVLLNGGVNTWTSWKPQLPFLTPHFDVLATTQAGNAGAPPLPAGPITGDAFTDVAEAAMDRAGFDTAHLAGYSLGGSIAMELARRGRARSVYAWAPSGGWTTEQSYQRLVRFFSMVKSSSRLGRFTAPVTARFGPVRHYLLRGTNEHGERMPYEAFVRLMHELAESTVPDALIHQYVFSTLEPYPDPGVPVTIAWPEHDRLLPFKHYGVAWQEAAPFAEWKTMPGIGHMPNYDDPELVAKEIIQSAARAPS